MSTEEGSAHSKDTRLHAAVFVLPLVACSAICVAALIALWMAPLQNTRYAPGYSEKAFRAVAVGDSEGRVLDLLGEPLEQTFNYASDLPRTYLWYTKPIGPSQNYALRNIVIEDGQVAQIYSQIWLD